MILAVAILPMNKARICSNKIGSSNVRPSYFLPNLFVMEAAVMKKLSVGLLALVCLMGGTGAVQADPIPLLFNTGVDALATPLVDGTIGDPHYALVGVPGGTTDIRVRTSVGGYPVGPWLGDDTLSAWIGPNNDTQDDGPFGPTYDYRTTFDLTGYNPSTAQITGQWSTDDLGMDILINGVSTGLTNSAEFASWTPFSITSGFQSGINTLDFLINNSGGGPTGLRVEMTGTATAVPEPGSIVMLVGMGLTGASLLLRRRK